MSDDFGVRKLWRGSVTIEVRSIRAYGKHGALAGERAREQPFDVDVSVSAKLDSACASDELGETLDYAAVHETVVRIVRERSFQLLERLADEIAREISQDERVTHVSVRVAKPGLLDGATPSVLVSYGDS